MLKSVLISITSFILARISAFIGFLIDFGGVLEESSSKDEKVLFMLQITRRKLPTVFH